MVPAMKRPVRAPLLVTRCEGCLRRRACTFVPFRSGWMHPLCRQCMTRIESACFQAQLDFAKQGR